jgi:hypothetical protein
MADLTSRIDALAEETGAAFPLSDGDAADLRADLAGRLKRLHAAEIRAIEALAD